MYQARTPVSLPNGCYSAPLSRVGAAAAQLLLWPPSSNRTGGFPASGSLGICSSARLYPAGSRRFVLAAQSCLGRAFRSRSNPDMPGQAGQPFLLLQRDTDRGPWLHGHYPASQLLRPHPTSEPIPSCGYGFPLGAGTQPPTGSDLSVPICIFRRMPSPSTPESPSAASIRCFTDGASFV